MTYLALSEGGPWNCERSMVDLTAVNRHSPQQMWPHGGIVGKRGGEKQIGQLYDARGSARDAFGRSESGGGATAGSGLGSATLLGLPFGVDDCEEADADGST